jgi:hypothetical protein
LRKDAIPRDERFPKERDRPGPGGRELGAELTHAVLSKAVRIAG